MEIEHIKSTTFVTFSCYFVFGNTLICVVYWQAHFDANYCNIHKIEIGYVPKAQRNLIGMNYNYRNYGVVYGRSHM